MHGHRLSPDLPRPNEPNEPGPPDRTGAVGVEWLHLLRHFPEDAQAGEDRRTIVYGVKRAVTTLSAVAMTPAHFLMYALPHQLWDEAEEGELAKAREWLTQLCEVWRERE